MKILENLKLDRWYGIVLYLGTGSGAASLLLEPKFLEQKHLFGLGMGMILIGLGYIMSERHHHEFAFGGILSTKINKHNFITFLLIILGISLIGIFGYQIINSLI